MCWQTVEQQFIPALAIASAVSAKRKTAETKFMQNDFLLRIIEQCPDSCVAELQCNWTSTAYSGNELAEIKDQFINSIQNCKTDRQTEVFKSHQFDSYKYKDTKFGQFTIWDGGLNLFVRTTSKNEIIERLEKYLNNSDICHCQIYTLDKHIAECYDSFTHSKLDSGIFTFTKEQRQKYAENDIEIYFDNFN